MREVLSVAAFTVPGVFIGGQVGPLVGAKLNPNTLKVSIAFLFLISGKLMLVTLAL